MNKTILVKELRVLLDALQDEDLLFVNAQGDLGVLRTEDEKQFFIGLINMTQGVESTDRWGKPYIHTGAYLLQRNLNNGQIEKRHFQAQEESTR